MYILQESGWKDDKQEWKTETPAVLWAWKQAYLDAANCLISLQKWKTILHTPPPIRCRVAAGQQKMEQITKFGGLKWSQYADPGRFLVINHEKYDILRSLCLLVIRKPSWVISTEVLHCIKGTPQIDCAIGTISRDKRQSSVNHNKVELCGTSWAQHRPQGTACTVQFFEKGDTEYKTWNIKTKESKHLVWNFHFAWLHFCNENCTCCDGCTRLKNHGVSSTLCGLIPRGEPKKNWKMSHFNQESSHFHLFMFGNHK